MRGVLWPIATAGLCLSLIAIVVGQVAPPTVRAATTGDTYISLSPVRLLDTRTNGETLGADANLNLQVAGIGEVPPNATAVAVNVTATDTTAPSFLTVYPTGETLPVSSNLNWSPGDTVANAAIIPVGSGGDLTFFNANGKVAVIVDLQGYFVASGSSGGDYVPLSPQRIADTRAGSGYPNTGQTLGAGSILNVQVGGVGGVPADGVSAAVLNVTVTDTTASSFLSVYPEGNSNPGTSSENWVPGVPMSNRVVVPLGSSGRVSVYNASGDADVVIDVSGYFTAGASSAAAASLYYPISPIRLLDTRVDGNKLAASGYLGEQFAGVDGISDQATAIVANLTSTDTSSPGFYTMSPEETTPTTSDLNWLHGVTVANLDMASLNPAGDTFLFNDQGTADAVIDVFGYFVPVGGTNRPALLPCSSVSLSATGPTVSGGPVDVTSRAICPSGESVQYTYWYLAPGASVWSLAAASSTNASFQYDSTSWTSGSYQLMVWASAQAGVYQGALGTATTTMSATAPPPVVTPPTHSYCPALGLFVPGQSPAAAASLAAQLGVTAGMLTVYAYNNYTQFSPPSTSMRLLLGVGEVTPAEATTIGDTLVATGHANTIIRIMWEMNGNWMQWGTQSLSAAQYIAIYQAAEQAFAAVPGNDFQYSWNVNAGTTEPGRTEFDTYPGDAYVSSIGIDFYDFHDDGAVSPVVAFAAAHGKPVSFDEWGLNGSDDPGFIDYVASVIHNPADDVTFEAYFSFDGTINSDITQFPLSEAEYRKDFAGSC
jgi:hypothetical protein